VVNFTQLHARWRAGWAGRQGDQLVMLRRSPRVSPYNAVGNAAAATNQLLQHSSELQRLQATPSVLTSPAAASTTAAMSPLLCCTE